MSIAKEIMAEKEHKEHNKKQNYTDMIKQNGTYSMSCPYCGYGLTDIDAKKEQCIHCKHIFKW